MINNNNHNYSLITGNLECAGIECLNGGVCFDLMSGYFCMCVVGFRGQHCQEGVYNT